MPKRDAATARPCRQGSPHQFAAVYLHVHLSAIFAHTKLGRFNTNDLTAFSHSGHMSEIIGAPTAIDRLSRPERTSTDENCDPIEILVKHLVRSPDRSRMFPMHISRKLSTAQKAPAYCLARSETRTWEPANCAATQDRLACSTDWSPPQLPPYEKRCRIVGSSVFFRRTTLRLNQRSVK